uniref:Uncharacterized protein n=1 Tax=candidate division WOR-3 bacterium TaxID=2052148 RepID=A0A7V1EHV4_UNCW3
MFVLVFACFAQFHRFKIIGFCPLDNIECFRITLIDTLAFLADGDLTVINIARPFSPFLITKIDTTSSFGYSIALSYPYAYAGGDYGFASYDISNLQIP